MVTAAPTYLDETVELFHKLHREWSLLEIISFPPVLRVGYGERRDLALETTVRGHRQYGGLHTVMSQGRPVYLVTFQGGACPQLSDNDVAHVYATQIAMVQKHVDQARLPMDCALTENLGEVSYIGCGWEAGNGNAKWLEVISDGRPTIKDYYWDLQRYLHNFALALRDWGGVHSFLEMTFIPIDRIGPPVPSDFSTDTVSQR